MGLSMLCENPRIPQGNCHVFAILNDLRYDCFPKTMSTSTQTTGANTNKHQKADPYETIISYHGMSWKSIGYNVTKNDTFVCSKS